MSQGSTYYVTHHFTVIVGDAEDEADALVLAQDGAGDIVDSTWSVEAPAIEDYLEQTAQSSYRQGYDAGIAAANEAMGRD